MSRANAAPAGPQLDPVKRLRGAVPPTGVTGAVFRNQRLFLAGQSNHTYEVWSVDTQTGDRKLKIETHICGESEGLSLFSTLGGRLHWLIAPSDDSGCKLTFGPESGLMHLRRSPGKHRFHVKVQRVRREIAPGSTGPTVEVTARVTRAGGKPVRGAHARLAGGGDMTNKRGRATISTTLETPGRFAVFARKGERFGTSNLIGLNIPESEAATNRSLR